MTLPLAEICDLDCVLSWNPLVLGTPETERYARGGDAIVRRVLGSWARNGGLFELSGRSFEDDQLDVVRARLARLAEDESYVDAATVTLELDELTNRLTITAEIRLIDGRTYALEVTTAEAGAAITALGSTA